MSVSSSSSSSSDVLRGQVSPRSRRRLASHADSAPDRRRSNGASSTSTSNSHLGSKHKKRKQAANHVSPSERGARTPNGQARAVSATSPSKRQKLSHGSQCSLSSGSRAVSSLPESELDSELRTLHDRFRENKFHVHPGTRYDGAGNDVSVAHSLRSAPVVEANHMMPAAAIPASIRAREFGASQNGSVEEEFTVPFLVAESGHSVCDLCGHEFARVSDQALHIKFHRLQAAGQRYVPKRAVRGVARHRPPQSQSQALVAAQPPPSASFSSSSSSSRPSADNSSPPPVQRAVVASGGSRLSADSDVDSDEHGNSDCDSAMSVPAPRQSSRNQAPVNMENGNEASSTRPSRTPAFDRDACDGLVLQGEMILPPTPTVTSAAESSFAKKNTGKSNSRSNSKKILSINKALENRMMYDGFWDANTQFRKLSKSVRERKINELWNELGSASALEYQEFRRRFRVIHGIRCRRESLGGQYDLLMNAKKYASRDREILLMATKSGKTGIEALRGELGELVSMQLKVNSKSYGLLATGDVEGGSSTIVVFVPETSNAKFFRAVSSLFATRSRNMNPTNGSAVKRLVRRSAAVTFTCLSDHQRSLVELSTSDIATLGEATQNTGGINSDAEPEEGLPTSASKANPKEEKSKISSASH